MASAAAKSDQIEAKACLFSSLSSSRSSNLNSPIPTSIPPNHIHEQKTLGSTLYNFIFPRINRVINLAKFNYPILS
jgi:hypothetical protein